MENVVCLFNRKIRRTSVHKLIIAALIALFSANAAFAEASCDAKAAEKKLAGAAKNSFVKKCEADAKAAAPAVEASSCDAKAAEKKLAGAAKNSFLKKCEADAKA